MEDESDNSSEGSDFIATSEMLTCAYDDESTINDDEDLEDDNEVDNLKLESDMPLEELLRTYASHLKSSTSRPIEILSSASGSDGLGKNNETSEDKSLVHHAECPESSSMPKIDPGSDQPYDEDDNHLARGSSRLWCKALIENNSNYNSEDDGDYIPIIDSKLFSNAQIRIGENYQTMSTNLVNSTNAEEYYSMKEREILLWKGANDTDQFQSDLKHYLKEYGRISGQTALTSTKIDDATALFSLMEHDYNITDTLMFLKNKPIRPSDLPNIMESWMEQEVIEFEKGFETYYKNFRLIHEQRLRTRTVAEIVEFYYFWKKTARYDEVIRWCKRDKKKQINQITDFIDSLASDSNGKKESCLLGNWPGIKVDNQILQISNEIQTAKFLNNILLRNGTEFESILGGDWNMTTSTLTQTNKESSDTNNDDKLSDESKTSNNGNKVTKT